MALRTLAHPLSNGVPCRHQNEQTRTRAVACFELRRARWPTAKPAGTHTLTLTPSLTLSLTLSFSALTRRAPQCETTLLTSALRALAQTRGQRLAAGDLPSTRAMPGVPEQSVQDSLRRHLCRVWACTAFVEVMLLLWFSALMRARRCSSATAAGLHFPCDSLDSGTTRTPRMSVAWTSHLRSLSRSSRATGMLRPPTCQ